LRFRLGSTSRFLNDTGFGHETIVPLESRPNSKAGRWQSYCVAIHRYLQAIPLNM